MLESLLNKIAFYGTPSVFASYSFLIKYAFEQKYSIICKNLYNKLITVD